MTRSQLTTLSVRLALAALAFAADFGIHGLDPAPRIEPDQILLFVILSVAAGMIIARWWATLIALACLFLAATIPPGGEDAGGALEVMVGMEIGLAQALLIGLGVAAAQAIRAWRRRT